MDRNRSMKRSVGLLVTIVIIGVLTGCAAGGILGLIFDLVAVGKLVASVDDLIDRFGGDADDYEVYYDGYPLGERPDLDGDLALEGLPAGTHLISVVDENKRTGFHQPVDIAAGQADLELGDYTPILGATIEGIVERQTGVGQVAVADQPVVAIFDGAELLRTGIGAPVTIPPAAGTVYVMGYTDNTGNYKLGPCQYGQWLIYTALPGYYADARLVTVSGDNDAEEQDLYLQENALEASARIGGAVASDENVGLADALVYSEYDTVYSPQLTAARAAQITGQAGFNFIAQPWVRLWRTGTIAGGAGAYTMRTKTGGQTIVGFKYDYRAESVDVNVAAGDDLNIDFALNER